jgi:hypothetical protein
MTGGLIQLVSFGKQDGYLTFNPQITYFKKIYRRHTIFGIELIENTPDQQAEYDNRISFKLNNISDLISKCYVEIELPSISFIESTQLTELKQNELQNITKSINKWRTLYENLKKYCMIEIQLYQILISLLDSININLTIIKQNTIKFNTKYKKLKDELINLIFNDIYDDINLSGYILQLNNSIVADEYIDYNELINIKRSKLKEEINKYYTNMITYLKYYHSNYIFNENKYNQLKNKNVNFAWIENLAHYFFTDFEVEIGGQVIEKYSADQSFIYQTHHIKEEQKKIYNSMIGNNKNLISFNNYKKNSTTLFLPLNFWFCKDIGSSLPAVALSNSSISINLKLNKLKNLIYFRDYEKEYYNLLKITIPFNKTIHNKLVWNEYKYDNYSKLLTYHCSQINYQLLVLHYPSLAKEDKNDTLFEIIKNYGKDISGNYIKNQSIYNNGDNIDLNGVYMKLNEWIRYKINYKPLSNDIRQILDRDSFNNYNQYYSLIEKPKIKLITECIYLDDIERSKFCSSKLEYVIELFQENLFDLDRRLLFNGELSLDRPTKELLWTTQPKLFLNGLCEFGKIYTQYDYTNFFENNIYTSYNILLNQMQLTKPKLTDTFYNELQSYKYYNNLLPKGVSAYNFGIFSEELQPSGTVNFTILKGKLINFNLNLKFIEEYFDEINNTKINPNKVGIFLKFYSRSYNFFVVEKGMGQILFSN